MMHNMSFLKIINNFKFILLFILITVSVLPYYPGFSNNYDPTNSAIAVYILIFTIILFLASLNISNILNSRFIKIYAVLIILSLLVAMLISSYGGFNINDSYNIFHEIRDISIPFIAIVIGYNLKLSNNKTIFILLYYAITIVLVGIMQVVINIGGLVIEQLYLVNTKISLGLMLAVAFSISLCMVSSKINSLLRIIFVILLFSSLLIIVTIRARTSMVVCLLMAIYYFFLQIKYKKANFNKTYLLLIIPIVIGIVVFGIDNIINYTTDSFFLGREGDITSGRTERNEVAIDIILDSPYFGRLSSNSKVAWVHNYVLRILSDYGLVGGFILVILFFYLFSFIIKKNLKLNTTHQYYLGFFIALIPFITSIVEPTFPYAPGTAVIFIYILLGYSLQHDYFLQVYTNSLKRCRNI